MNPWGLLLILLGFLMIVIGIKGTQSTVLGYFKSLSVGKYQLTTPGTTKTGTL